MTDHEDFPTIVGLRRKINQIDEDADNAIYRIKTNRRAWIQNLEDEIARIKDRLEEREQQNG